MFDYQIFAQQEYGGVSRYHIELARKLNKLNDLPVNISCRYSINEYLHEYDGHKKLNIKKNKYIRKILKIRNKIFNELKCKRDAKIADIVHITWVNPYLNKEIKGKFIVTVHDMIHELYWSNMPGVFKEIARKKAAIYGSDAIIAISQNTKKDILKLYPDIPEDKISVIYHGTNHLPIATHLNRKIPNNYILYVGRRQDYKGFDFMIKALSDLLIANKEIKLLFVGGGDFNNQEYHAFEKLGILNSVIQMSVCDAELACIYHHAICFVYPSLYEGFGFPILEAFDNECPCICTNASCLPEVGGDAALYFEKDNGQDLMEKVELMISNSKVRQEYIKRGQERVKMFTWEKCAKETYEVYKNVCGVQ